MSSCMKKPGTVASNEYLRNSCPACGAKNEGWLVGNADTQETIALAAIIIACTPIVVAVLAGVILLILLFAAIFIFIGLTMAAVLAVFLGAAVAAASQ